MLGCDREIISDSICMRIRVLIEQSVVKGSALVGCSGQGRPLDLRIGFSRDGAAPRSIGTQPGLLWMESGGGGSTFLLSHWVHVSHQHSWPILWLFF